MKKAESLYFPCALNVAGRVCVVVGDGRDMLDKSERLLKAGAAVKVVSAFIEPDDHARLEKKGAVVIRRKFEPRDIEKAFFVVLCVLNEPKLTEQVAAYCREKKILLCAIDQPAYCDIVNVSTYEKGLLRLTVSTGGSAPGVSRKIRQGLEQSLKDVPIDDFLKELEDLRSKLSKTMPNGEERRAALLKAVEDFEFSARMNLPKAWTKKKEGTKK